MASRTQMRLAQITGSFGNDLGQISDQRPEQSSAASAAALQMSSGSLLGPLSEMASAIRRIHGADQFAKAQPGQFLVDIQSMNILPDLNNSKNLGSNVKRFADLHLGTSINLDGVAITSIKDEDNMVSDSVFALATQQSIKAYVDAVDLTTGLQAQDDAANNGAASTLSTSQTLTINSGEGLTASLSGQTFTIAGEDSSASNKGVVIVEGTASEIAVVYSAGTATVGLPTDVIIAGNLTVNGAQFKIDGETVVMDDTLLEMGTVNKIAPTNATSKDMGILIHQHDGSNASLNFMGWDDSENKYTFRAGVTDGGSGILTGLGVAAAVEVGPFDAGNSKLNELIVTNGSFLNGDVNLGSGSAGDIYFNGRIQDGAILPRNDDQVDLGSATLEFKDLWIDGVANIDSLVADTADINAGTIDGAIIGGAVAAAGTFTALACDAKALDAAALNIAARADITLHIDDVFAISDTSDSDTIMKVSLGNIQTFLAANGSQKNVVLQGSILGAGTALASGITDFGAAGSSTREVYVNGQLMYEDAAGDFEVTGDNVDFAFDLEADDVVQFIKRA